MKNSVLRGSLILLIAGLVAKVFGAIYRIPLSNILGADGIGIYQMIFPIFSLCLILSSGGVSATVSHCVAKIRATNCGDEKKVFMQGLLFSLFVSVFFAIIFLLFSKNIALFQGNALASYGYKISAIALVFASLLAPFRGLFQGRQNMVPTAISQVLEQVAKVCFGLVFAVWFSKYGVEFGVCGAFLGIALSEIFAFLFLLVKTFHNRKFFVQKAPKNTSTNFWKTNFAITFSAIILPLVLVFDSLVVVNILDNYLPSAYATSLYGLQSGIVTSLINFPVIISVAISLALLPNLSGYVASGEISSASKNLSKVVEILLILLIPFVLVFVFFAKDILMVLYPTLDEALLTVGTKLLQLSAINVLGISFLQIFISVFQSLGQKVQTVVWVLIGCGIIKIASLLLLTANVEINILGMTISNILFYLIGAFTLLVLVKKKIPIYVNQKNLLVCLLSAFFVAISFFAINVYIDSLLAKIFVAGVVGVVFYVLPLAFLGEFNIKQFTLKGNYNE